MVSIQELDHRPPAIQKTLGRALADGFRYLKAEVEPPTTTR
jgi:hypothetical protein